MAHTMKDLQYLQALPLNLKIQMTKARIREWVNHYGIEGVAISFSGGKDSTVLLDICRSMYPDMRCVYFDTSLEYPEIREFVKTFDNVEWIRPPMNFKQVVQKYGYPIISKEVSESIYGAKKYIQSLLTEINNSETVQTDRQTDRQLPYAQFYRKICGFGEYAKGKSGGYDHKYRKVRGIGEYSKQKNDGKVGRCESEISDNVGMADKGTDDTGKYP